MGSAPHPAVRAVALLLSMAVAGALIGLGWERLSYEAMPDPVEVLPPEEMNTLQRREGRSPQEEAVLQRALQHFPPYPRGTRPEVLAADYLGAEAPIAVAWFSTQDTPDQVLRHYSGTLLDAGLPTVGERYSEHAGYVGYWSPSTEEMHLVSVLAQGGETLVFVSSGRVAPLLEGSTKVPEWIPLPPNTAQATALTFQLEGATQYTVSGQVPEGTVLEVSEHLREGFSERGWSVDVVRPADEGAAEFEVRRGRVRGMVMVRRQVPSPEVVIYLSLTERVQAPPRGSSEDMGP